MAHEHQERYSALVLAKLRNELKLKDGVVFNNDYEGNPTAGVVKIPVRDDEVSVSDYDKANGVAPKMGTTTYAPLLITKDKAINEIIDGYDAAAVPDNLVADRLDSGSYSLARQMDTDGATTLLAGSTRIIVDKLGVENVYAAIVDLRTKMSKANIPDDGKRYLLVIPEVYAYILKCDEFTPASQLGDDVKQTGAVGKIAGFLVIEWNDSTANLQMIAGHPKYATRAKEWAVPVKLQGLDGSGNYIGASAVQGRMVYDHKVLRSIAILSVFEGSVLAITATRSEEDKGIVKLTVTGGKGSLMYAVTPNVRAMLSAENYAGKALESGVTEINAKAGDEIEVVDVVNGKVSGVGYIKLEV